MRKRYLAWSWQVAPAHHGGRRRAVMRRAEWALAPARGLEAARRDGMDRRDLERFGFRERRQDAGKAPREHRLAGARRADHQHAVAPGGRHLQRALGVLLALHLAEVRIGRPD